MFIDASLRPQREKHQVGKLKLSQAIKQGSHVCGSGGPIWATCAIGAAHFAITGRRFEGDEWNGLEAGRIAEQWAERFGYDPKVARRVQTIHDMGGRIQGAIDWLESQG